MSMAYGHARISARAGSRRLAASALRLHRGRVSPRSRGGVAAHSTNQPAVGGWAVAAPQDPPLAKKVAGAKAPVPRVAGLRF